MIFNKLSYRKKLLLSFFSFSLLIIVSIGVFIIYIVEKKRFDHDVFIIEKLYKYKVHNFHTYIDELEDKLFALKNSKLVMDYLHNKNEQNLKIAEELFLNIAHSSSRITQLRYIDADGMERIRTNRESSSSLPYLVPRDELQNKRHRYYFTQISQAPHELVSYSKIDLNREYGELERPIKPVLRAGVPCVDKGKLQGILIINFFMQDFLDELVNSNEYDIYLVDKEDHLLVSTDKQHNWSNYIKQGHSNGSGFRFSDIKLEAPFYANTLNFDNGEALRLVLKSKKNRLIETLSEETKYIVLLLVFISVLSFPLAYVFSRYPARLEKELSEHNRYLQTRVDEAVALHQEQEAQCFKQARYAQMGEMIAMIAHQWRQPLSAIASRVGALQMKRILGTINDQYLETELENISSHTQHLSTTIDDFRAFLQEEKEKQVTTLEAVAEGSLAIIQPLLKAHNISVIKQYQGNTELSSYPNELKQVLINLIQNAKEAFEGKEIEEKRVEIKTYKDQGGFYMEVYDNAGGIDQGIIEKIFEPYYTTKGSLNGTGLGLYMSKMIVEKNLNGKIYATNKDEGVSFLIELT